jgi:hypothetical protein
LTSVAVMATAAAIIDAPPEPLFTASVDQNKTIRNRFAVSRDGQRFLLLSLIDREASPFVTVLNGRALVRN